MIAPTIIHVRNHPHMSSLHDHFIEQATADLEAARANSESGRFALACWLCHQSAARAVTSFLYAHGAEHVWGEALADLCEDAKAFDPSFEFIKSIAGLLDKHYLTARIPTALPSGAPCNAYDATDASRALEVAQDVLEGVTERLQDMR